MMKKRKFAAFIFAFKRIEVFSCIAACYTEITGKGYAEKYVYIFFQYINRFPQKAQVCDFSANVRSVQQTILSQNSCCGFAAWLPRPSESPGLLDMKLAECPIVPRGYSWKE